MLESSFATKCWCWLTYENPNWYVQLRECEYFKSRGEWPYSIVKELKHDGLRNDKQVQQLVNEHLTW